MHDRNTIPPHPCQGALIDYLVERLNLKNDAALAKEVGLAPPTISKLRHGVLPVSPFILIQLHDKTGMSIADLRAILTPTPGSYQDGPNGIEQVAA
jgi:plasmid maintenance system antidote protein VapI